MGCLFVLFASFVPRLAVLIVWLARPAHFADAFGDAILLPMLGVIFVPFTTLMYVVLWSPTGLAGLDWLWLVLALALDIGHWGSSIYANRNRVPGYTDQPRSNEL